MPKNKLLFCQTPVHAVQAMHRHGNFQYGSSSYLCTQGHVITVTLIFLSSNTWQFETNFQQIVQEHNLDLANHYYCT